MGKMNLIRVVLSAISMLWTASRALAQDPTPDQTNVAARANEVLRAATEYLAAVPSFSVSAELWRERVTESGQKLQFTRLVEFQVKRPDRLRIDIHSVLTDRGFWYDGKALTVLDRKRNVFSSAVMPATLDAALDMAHDEYGIDLPLMDLAVSDPYKSAIDRVQTGRYFGVSSVLGVECHHLAFTQDNIDWQLWVEAGPHPLIRKLLITHKNDPGSPEFTALLTHWDIVDPVSTLDFVFQPPPGAVRVEMHKTVSEGSHTTAPAAGQ